MSNQYFSSELQVFLADCARVPRVTAALIDPDGLDKITVVQVERRVDKARSKMLLSEPEVCKLLGAAPEEKPCLRVRVPAHTRSNRQMQLVALIPRGRADKVNARRILLPGFQHSLAGRMLVIASADVLVTQEKLPWSMDVSLLDLDVAWLRENVKFVTK